MIARVCFELDVPFDSVVDSLGQPELEEVPDGNGRMRVTAAWEAQQKIVQEQRTQAAKDAEKMAAELGKQIGAYGNVVAISVREVRDA